MTFNAACSTPRRVGLVIATIWLAGCAAAGSDRPAIALCPPVVSYDAAFLARAADEVEALQDGSALADMIADYGVMREQARACGE